MESQFLQTFTLPKSKGRVRRNKMNTVAKIQWGKILFSRSPVPVLPTRKNILLPSSLLFPILTNNLPSSPSQFSTLSKTNQRKTKKEVFK
jgi:hypothetical protein